MSIFADAFTDMMAETVTIAPLTGRASDGTPTYGAAVSYAARVVFKIHNVIGKENQLVAARGIAWVDCGDPVAADALVTLPDGSTPIILQIDQPTDETGTVALTRLDFQ